MPLPTSIKHLLRCFFLSISICCFDQSAIGQLRASFTVSKQGGCAPLVVSFNNTTTGASANATWKWDFGNGNRSVTRNPGAIYSDEKVYTVTLTVQDGSNTSTATQQVTVYNKPTVDFSARPVKQCRPEPVEFTSSSTAGSGTISNYFWDFGDGITQAGYNNTISHSYNAENQYSVSLTVTNNYGCFSTLRKDKIVNIIQPLVANFVADKTFLCQITEPVRFTNTSSGPGTLTYLWDFGDGTTSTDASPTHVFSKKGIHTIKLTTTSSEGCTISSTKPAYINVATYGTDFDAPSTACVGQYFNFVGKGSPVPISATWEVNGVIESYWYHSFYRSFTTPGTYTIKLTSTYATGCVESVSKQITVNPLPEITGFLSVLSTPCGAPTTVTFTDTTRTAVQWSWNFDYYDDYYGLDGSATTKSASFTYPRDGYPRIFLSVTDANGCRNSAQKTVPVMRPSVAVNITSAQPLTDCKPITATFTANAPANITRFLWVFGDGTTSTEASPTHTFTQPGNYSVSLNYTMENGCTGSSFSNRIIVNKKPTIDFKANVTEVCGSTPVTFTAGPFDPTIDYWEWDFGNGRVESYYGNNHSRAITFLKDGIYTVKLKVKNLGCDTAYVTKTDYIKVKPPHVIFDAAIKTCDGTRGDVTFKQNSLAATTVTWDFGDNTPSVTIPGNQETLTHTYTRSGSYTVTLTAVNGTCSEKTSKRVDVYLKQRPGLTFQQTKVCDNMPLTYTISGFDANPSDFFPGYNQFFWINKFEYNDGTEFTGVRDWVINKNGGAFTAHLYNIDKSKSSIRAIFTATNMGCPDTTSFATFDIIEGPVAEYEVVKDRVCFNDKIILRDISRSPNGTIQSVEWNFQDGSYSSQRGTVEHKYDHPTAYWPTLRVTDNSGCPSQSAFGMWVHVHGPKAAFYPSSTSIIRMATVSFYNSTNEYGAMGTQFQWDFGDGSTSTDRSPSHQYAQAGTYIVKLKAIDPTSGCTSEAPPVTIVVGEFLPAFTYVPNSITGSPCAPIQVYFNNISLNYTRVSWDFGDGYRLDNVVYPSHVYDKPGKYTVTLTIYGSSGQVQSYQREISIGLTNVSMQLDVKEGCIGHTPTFTAAGDPALAYTWDMGDGNVNTSNTPTTSHSYTAPGVYTPVVLANSGNGCLSTGKSADKVTIRPNPAIAIAPAAPVLCLGSTVTLSASGGRTYSWSPGNGLSATNVAAPVASPRNNTTYTVEGTDDLGCKNTSSVSVQVIQPTVLQVTPTAEVCAGGTITLNASGAERYFWIFNTSGLSATNTANPYAKPPASLVYTVRGTDVHDCFSDTADIAVTVNTLPTVDAGPGKEVLPGTPINFSPTYSNDAIRFNWMPNKYLDCNQCPTPVSKPMSETKYYLTVWNRHECSATDSLLVKMICAEDKVGIPNAFTPNNDGTNDLWHIKGISVVKHLVIYNRWGQRIFERHNFIAADRSSAWDGTFNGYHCPPGTYVYFVEMECPSGGKFARQGSIILTR